MNAAKNKVIVIEPSVVVREGLKVLLQENAAFRIVGEYDGVEEFKNVHHLANFDILLFNPAVVSGHRKFAARNVFPNYNNAAFVALVYGFVNGDILDGFDGVVDIFAEPPQIVKRLRRIVQEFGGKENAAAAVEISDREKEILVAVAKGMSNKEIADKCFISVHTVVAHRKNITRKTGIHTVAGLTLYAVFNNMVSQEDLG